jgi:hypothetical protein
MAGTAGAAGTGGFPDDQGSSDGVRIAIARDPALVRTVRLVAAAVARRTGQGEELVEEVRLAVGEACALLVGPTPSPAPLDHSDTVTVTMSIGDELRVEVTGEAAAGSALARDEDDVDPWALLRGLNGELDVETHDRATAVSMAWALI